MSAAPIARQLYQPSKFGTFLTMRPRHSRRTRKVTLSSTVTMPKAQSTSSHKTAAKKSLGITRGWHKGFVGYLEKYQTEWDSLDAEEMQQFLRDRRDGLIAWRKDNKILKDLPETSELKNVWQIHLLISPNMLTVVGSILPAIIHQDSLWA